MPLSSPLVAPGRTSHHLLPCSSKTIRSEVTWVVSLGNSRVSQMTRLSHSHAAFNTFSSSQQQNMAYTNALSEFGQQTCSKFNCTISPYRNCCWYDFEQQP